MQLALEEFSNRQNDFIESQGVWIKYGNLFKCYLYLVLLLNLYMENKFAIY
jgi:hypothetical protein